METAKRRLNFYDGAWAISKNFKFCGLEEGDNGKKWYTFEDTPELEKAIADKINNKEIQRFISGMIILRKTYFNNV